jgi:hypothetical protein
MKRLPRPLCSLSGISFDYGAGCIQVSDQEGNVVEIPYRDLDAVAVWIAKVEEATAEESIG